jgi:hypothetical protein
MSQRSHFFALPMPRKIHWPKAGYTSRGFKRDIDMIIDFAIPISRIRRIASRLRSGRAVRVRPKGARRIFWLFGRFSCVGSAP